MLSITELSSITFFILASFWMYSSFAIFLISLLFSFTLLALTLASLALLLPSIAFEDNIFTLESTSSTDAVISSVAAPDSCIPPAIVLTASLTFTVLAANSSTVAESSSADALIYSEFSIIIFTIEWMFSVILFKYLLISPSSSLLFNSSFSVKSPFAIFIAKALTFLMFFPM